MGLFSTTANRGGLRARMTNRTDVSNRPEVSTIAEEALLNDDEVSALLGVPRSTLRAWRTRGIGPRFIRLSPRTPRCRIADVRSWIDSRAAAHLRCNSTTARRGA